MKSKVMILAHSVKAEFPSFSDALKFAWAKCKLKKKLSDKVCFFSFVKKSTGEMRDALGTLNFEYIDYPHKTNYIRRKWYIQSFWDTCKNDWRCLDVRTLNKIHW